MRAPGRGLRSLRWGLSSLLVHMHTVSSALGCVEVSAQARAPPRRLRSTVTIANSLLLHSLISVPERLLADCSPSRSPVSSNFIQPIVGRHLTKEANPSSASCTSRVVLPRRRVVCRTVPASHRPAQLASVQCLRRSAGIASTNRPLLVRILRNYCSLSDGIQVFADFYSLIVGGGCPAVVDRGPTLLWATVTLTFTSHFSESTEPPDNTMNIQSLLNSPASGSRASCGADPSSPLSSAQQDPAFTATKRQKLAKDAPVFAEGTPTVGHVNYPPYDAGSDRDLQAKHREFHVFPLGEIHKKGVRHIPYASDKKDFLEKTGREAFEVFQYTYRVPGEDKNYVVVWDYNVGLVRMTPFFKSCKYSKTVPAKALNHNPGLRDISYSITGGALVCQGYWVPWQAAREIAATFCWEIRFALTPIFGNDFPQKCRPLKDRAFGKFAIDPEIVRFCTAETDRFKYEGASYQTLLPKATSSVATSVTPVFSTPVWTKETRATPSESGYGTSEEHDDNSFSGQISPRSQYDTKCLAAMGGARPLGFSSTPHLSTLNSPVAALAPTPLSMKPYCESLGTKRTHSKIMNDDCDGAVARASSPLGMWKDSDQDTFQSEVHSAGAVEAAEILLSLGAVTRDAAALSEPKRTRRGGARH
ncbi:hypothetical protein OPT61_g4456 [Boeremia exigua]|uniref:Uncharacterized protein n=1 Tax=Boeremia exigua TaxID=749465 RepID=A0ACC2IE23_9PLEO|nr:hypothetical protein OPT61_g4456 [Boeremia exigua]